MSGSARTHRGGLGATGPCRRCSVPGIVWLAGGGALLCSLVVCIPAGLRWRRLWQLENGDLATRERIAREMLERGETAAVPILVHLLDVDSLDGPATSERVGYVWHAHGLDAEDGRMTHAFELPRGLQSWDTSVTIGVSDRAAFAVSCLWRFVHFQPETTVAFLAEQLQSTRPCTRRALLTLIHKARKRGDAAYDALVDLYQQEKHDPRPPPGSSSFVDVWTASDRAETLEALFRLRPDDSRTRAAIQHAAASGDRTLERVAGWLQASLSQRE